MADNTTLNTGSGGDVIATDDIGGVKHQLVKVEFGAADSATQVSAAAPLPVVQTGTHAVNATLAAETTKVIGTVNVAAAQTIAATIAAGATAIAKAEDVASADADVGVPALAVRKAAPANTSGTDGDYEFLQISAGRLWASATIDAALPAGANAIGKLAANSGVDIGDVDITSVVPGVAATSLGKAEDAAHADGDTGVMSLAVRRDANTSLVSATGDYAPLQVDATGNLKVAIISGAGSGGTSIADAAAFTRGTTSATPVTGVVETSAPTLTNGNAGTLSLTTAGAVRVDVSSGGITGRAEDAASAGGEDGVMVLAVRRDSASSGVSADGDFAALSVDSNGALRVVGSTAATQYVEDVASAGAESMTLAGTVRRDTAASSAGTDGDYATLNTDSTGRLHVNVGNTVTVGSHAVTNAGVFAVQLNGASGVGATDIGKAEDAVAASGDVGVAVLAVRRDSAASGVSADGDYANLSVDVNGALRVTGAGGGTQFAEDVAATSGDTGTMVLAVRQDTISNSVSADGDYGTVKLNSVGRVYTSATVDAALPAGANTIGAVTIASGATAIAKAEDVASADADVGVPAMAIRKAIPVNTSGTDGDYEMLQMAAGRLWVDPSGVTLTVASHAVTNAGTFAVQESSTHIQADDAAFTPATSKISMAGYTADETATDSVDEGDGGAARMTLDRKQIVAQYVHAAAGGSSSYSALSAAAVLTAQIKSGAGRVYNVQIFNTNAAARFVRLYDQTGAPASGDGANIIWRGIIPGATTGAGFVIQFPEGKQFATGIGIRASAAVADNDTTVLAANELAFNVSYA